MSTTIKNEILYSVTAQRGDDAALQGLEAGVAAADAREQHGGGGEAGAAGDLRRHRKCARNWESYHAIVDSLMTLENDETLAVQSGMPVAIFKTHRLAPRVVMANTNIMKATWPVFYDLQDKNLTMFAQYTAAPWEYIGTQGVIQGTFETLAAIAEQHFSGSLIGRILFTAGLGAWAETRPGR